MEETKKSELMLKIEQFINEIEPLLLAPESKAGVIICASEPNEDGESCCQTGKIIGKTTELIHCVSGLLQRKKSRAIIISALKLDMLSFFTREVNKKDNQNSKEE